LCEYGDSAGRERYLFDAGVSVRTSDVDNALVITGEGEIAGMVGKTDRPARAATAGDAYRVIGCEGEQFARMRDGEVGQIRK